MNTTIETQNPTTEAECVHCTRSDAADFACATTPNACTDCCPCCGTGEFVEFGGRVFPSVSLGSPWNGWATPVVTREVAERIAEFLEEEGALCSLTFDGDTAVVRDLEGDQADDVLTPSPEGHYDLGGLGWMFSRDNGPANDDQVDR